MWTTYGIPKFAVFILALQAIIYCHGVYGDVNESNLGDTNLSDIPNSQGSKLLGGIMQSLDSAG